MEDKSEEWDKQERFNDIESIDDIAEVHLIDEKGFVKVFKDGEKLPHDGYKLFAIKLRDGTTINWTYYFFMMELKKLYHYHKYGCGL